MSLTTTETRLISAVVTPLVAAVLCLFIEVMSGFNLTWFRPSLALALLAFGFNARWGNGLVSNLFAATFITLYGFWSVHFEYGRIWQVAIIVYVIAIANGYLKRKIREEQDAVTRQQVQIERLRNERNHKQLVLEELVKSSDVIEANIRRIRQARKLLVPYSVNNKDIFEALGQLNNAELSVVGWEALAKVRRSVQETFGE